MYGLEQHARLVLYVDGMKIDYRPVACKSASCKNPNFQTYSM